MGKRKHQHTVPSMYLKRFATPETRGLARDKRRIFQYTIADGTVENLKVAKATTKYRYYDIGHDPKQAVENFLGSLEDKAAPLIEKMVGERSAEGLTHDGKIDIARFLATQYIRTQKYREQNADVVQARLKLMREQPDKARKELRMKSDFMKEQARQNLQGWHMSIVNRRLDVLQLPKEEQDKVMPELDELLEQFYEIEAHHAEHSADFLEGNFSDRDLEQIERGLGRLSSFHMNEIFKHLPVLTARFLDMEWQVHRHLLEDSRLTSDNPLILDPLCVPIYQDDAIAHMLTARACLGKTELYKEELLQDYPSMAFLFPISPSLDLALQPPGVMPFGNAPLSAETTAWFNRLQIVQAHNWLFSHSPNFPDVPEALEARKQYQEVIETIQKNAPDTGYPVPTGPRYKFG